MSNRVIDFITEQEDKQPVRNEWHWLVGPLANVTKLAVDQDPENLYYDQTETMKDYIPFLDTYYPLEVLANDWESRFETITERKLVPFVLLGDIGVGKTSWIHRFICYLKNREDITFVYYDHHKETGRPDGKHLKEAIRLHCLLNALLLKAIQEVCKKRALLGSDVLKIKPDAIAMDPKNITMSVTDAMKEACNRMFLDQKYRLVFIIDNLDEYPKDLQETAVDFCDHVATWSGLSMVISLRPETYRYTKKRLGHHRPTTVYPASLDGVLRRRLRYLWKGEGRESVDNVINTFQKNNLSLTVLWSKDTIDHNPETLRSLHIKIVDVLTDNRILNEALQMLHNFNMREMLEIVGCLLTSGFFSEEIISRMTDRSPHFVGTKREAIITTYLRGPYLRYRGPTFDYPVKMLNVLDVPNVRTEHALISIRVMQLLGKSGTGPSGDSVQSLVSILGKYAYPSVAVQNSIILLSQNGFIRDVKEQKPWQTQLDVQLSETDKFMLTPAGRYLLTRLFNEFAFRYCEAVADTMRKSRNDGGSWNRERGYDALVYNAIGVLRLLLSAAESEILRICRLGGESQRDRTAAILRFRKEFNTSDVLGGNFLLTLTEGCKTMSRYFVEHAFEKAANYQAQNKLKSLTDEVSKLCEKARQIYDGKLC